MKINGVDVNINDLINDINNDSSMIKLRENDLYLSDDQINVLKKYDIDYKKYASLNMLIFDIEEILNEETEVDDLEELSKSLAETNYYNNTKK